MSVLLPGPFALALLARLQACRQEPPPRTSSSSSSPRTLRPSPILDRSPSSGPERSHQQQQTRPTRRFGLPRSLVMFLVLLLVAETASGCGPGRGGGRRRSPRKLTPLVFKQHVPNVSENTLAASGLREGRLTRYHARFKELVPNYNSDIIFKDEEGTGADRLMTQRCKEKLNTLAISVMNQWPGVKLRVTEGWDEEGHHATDSLHYEGRAVDITTSDRDRSKYGMLARLAVEAGFDWVYYESRSHIHCSVKSESSEAARSGGCLQADSVVETADRGRVPVSDVRLSDLLLAMSEDGQLGYSRVLLFLDRDESQSREFARITTDHGVRILLTPGHLIYVQEELRANATTRVKDPTDRVRFANAVRPGHWIMVKRPDGDLEYQRVSEVTAERLTGFYAPLTAQGNLVVNGIVVSCYAVIESQNYAHAAFAPLRIWDNAKYSLLHLMRSFGLTATDYHTRTSKSRHLPPKSHQRGIHWYAKILYFLGHLLLPKHYLFH